MKFLSRAVLALAPMMLLACGEKATPPVELPTPPVVVSFAANKLQISAGESVTLSFAALQATSATLMDGLGETIPLSGDASQGSAVVTPPASTFYLLRVVGEGGADSSFVQVAVDEDLKQVFLVPMPSRIDSGKTSQLLWSAFHAKEARLQSSSGAVLQLDVSKGSGIVEVSPERTTAYTLVGTGGQGPLTATAEVKVAPILQAFDIAPAAARAGEKLTLQWRTAGAAQVSLSEATFGELNRASHPAETAQVDDGSFEWTVPDHLPGGQPVIDGQPLRFTLTVTQGNPATMLTRSLDSFVGQGPRITGFVVPQATTAGRSIELGWSTVNSERLQIFANGAVVYETLAHELDQVAQGSVTLGPPAGSTTYELVAWGHEGTHVSVQKQVRVVAEPSIDSFTLPAMVNQIGDAALASWTTHGAAEVTLRIMQGPVVFATSTPSSVASGSAPLYPGSPATFVLEAWNEAGQKVTAERTVDVFTPGTIAASTSPVTRGDQVTMTWSVSVPNLSTIIGDPTLGALRTPTSQNFVDLAQASAQTLAMGDPDESVSVIPFVVPFRFPFLGPVIENFYVSTNGFVAFEQTEALPNNGGLSGTSVSAPMMIAPFWDDLRLGAQGRILYAVDGSNFPRRLIIQWDRVQTAAGGELTFQVQLLESGEFHMVYKSLSGADSAGEHATVGWRASNTSAETVSQDAASLATGDELAFLTGGAVTGQIAVTPPAAGTFTLFSRLPDGKHVVFPAHVNVLVPGSLQINEVMVSPEASATLGQWVEVANLTDEAIDLSGATLNSTASSFTLPEGTAIQPHGYLVIGASTDPAENGGAAVDLAWTDFVLAPTGDGVDVSATAPLAESHFAGADVVAGVSWMNSGRIIGATGAPFICRAKTRSFGANGALGTPGAANESCFPYTLEKIPSQFEDISLIGTRLTSLYDGQRVQVDLSSAPFTFFGSNKVALWADTDGDLTFLSPTSDSPDNSATPAAAAVRQFGMIAPYWDDIVMSDSRSGVYIMHRPANWTLPARWIVQWAHATHKNSTDDLNFQVKLFEDGAIEYHYADMHDGSFPTAKGASSTAWLCAPDFLSALPISINQPNIEADTAWRFAPTH